MSGPTRHECLVPLLELLGGHRYLALAGSPAGDLSGRVFGKRRGYPMPKAAVADHRLPLPLRAASGWPFSLWRLDSKLITQRLGAKRAIINPLAGIGHDIG